MRVVATGLLLAALLPSRADGARPADPLGQDWLVREWRTEDGLPTDHLTGLALGADGRLWISTLQGLLSFDGRTFTPVAVGSPPGLHSPRVVRVMEEPGGDALWLAFEDDFLERRSLEGTTLFEPPGSHGYAIAESADRIYYLTGGRELWALEGEPRRLATFAEPVHDLRIGAGDVLHVQLVDLGPWIALDADFQLLHGRTGPDVRVAARGVGPWEIRGYDLFRDGERMIGGPDRVVDLVEVDGALWVASLGRGLLRISPRAITVILPPEGVPPSAERLWWDPSTDVLWARSDGHVWWRVDDPVQRLGPPQLADQVVRPGRIAATSTLPIARDGGHRWWANRGALVAETPTGVAPIPGTPLFWDMLETFTAPDGVLWFGTGRGLHRWDGRAFETLRHPDGAEVVGARSFAALPGGAVVVAGTGGLSWVGPGTGEAVGPLAPWPVTVRHVRLAGDVLWAATEGRGLCALRVPAGEPAWESASAWRCVQEYEGLGTYGVHASVEDGRGRTWVSANAGLAWAPTPSLDRFAAGEQDRVYFSWLGVGDGMQSAEANGHSGGSAFRSADGLLFFPTQAGVVRVDPARVPDPSPPTVRIAGIEVAGRPVSGAPVEVPDGSSIVRVQWEAIALGSARAPAVRFRLNRSAWNPLGDDTSLVLPSLAPGDHVLEVQAGNGERWGSPARVAFVRPPLWWERPAARLALAVLIPGLVVFGLVLRDRAARRREEDLRTDVELATAALATQNAQLADQAAALSDLATDLDEKNRRLAAQAGDLDAQNLRLETQARDLDEQNHRLQCQAEELRVLYEHSAAQTARLLDLDRMKRALLANVSHELRTPLALIMGPLGVVRDGLVSSQDRDAVDLALRNAERLRVLVRQLLEVARAQAGTLTVRVRRVRFGRMIGERLRRFPIAGEAAPTVRLPDPDPEVWCDPELIDTVLGNLVANAREHGAGPIEVDVTVLDEDGARPASVCVAVRDHGPGVPADQADAVFERFGRAGAPSQGLGLGLSLSRELVQLHGGSLAVEPAAGGGARFWFTLPLGVEHLGIDEVALDAAEREAAADRDDRAASPEPDGQGPRVLLVEDNDELRPFLSSHLARHYQTTAVPTAEAAAAALGRRAFDLLVSDVMLPGMSGLELAAQVRREVDPAPSILLISALGDVVDRVEGLAVADDYLAKPFQVRELVARCDALLRRRPPPAVTDAGRAPPEPEVQPPEHVGRFVASLESALDGMLSDPSFGVEELAAAVGTSRRALYDRIAAIGLGTPGAWMREHRLSRAIALIDRGTFETVGEVAAAVGISRAWFTRMYAARVGVSPGARLKERFRRRPTGGRGVHAGA